MLRLKTNKSENEQNTLRNIPCRYSYGSNTRLNAIFTHHAVVVLVADEVGLLALLMSSPEELSTAEANDAAVVTDVHVTELGLVLQTKALLRHLLFFLITENEML